MGKRAKKLSLPADSPGRPSVAASRGRLPWRRIVVAVAICGIALAVWASGRSEPLPVYGYQVVNVYPHDPAAYCQGLVYVDGQLYEGTGKYGRSTLRQVDLTTGRVQRQVALDRRLFGEGITVWKDQIIQLTWQKQVGLIYDRQTFRQTGQFRYAGEGWGLTHDGQQLIVSDGTSTLRFLDPQTYRVTRRLTVRSNGQRVRNLNELEYVEGEILANVWKQDYLVRISPRTGAVTAYIDLRGLWPHNQRPDNDAVLNGIAYDAAGGRLFVTGKNWPRLYEIKLVERP